MKNPLKIRKNSLYGLAIPPYSWYIYYIGEPLYKIGRKIGLPKIGALANVPGSLSHVYPELSNGDFGKATLYFGVSELIFTGVLYGFHKLYGVGRKKKDNFRSGFKAVKNSTIEDLI